MLVQRSAPAAVDSAQRFLGDYVARTREFSRNANLYVVHVIGMDMIHGSFNVLFNLYLLAIGFDIRFIGLRLMVQFIFRAITAMPAGLVSDRIGRKASFILGDGVGALIALIMIHTTSEAVLLVGPAVGSFFGNLHHTSESAFMAENSRPSERIHLFSVAGSFRTFSAMSGALLAGLVPAMFIDNIGAVDAYRYATYAGLSLWFLSLVPALMLRSVEAVEQPERQGQTPARPQRSFRTLLSDIKHPRLIFFFVLTSALISFGSSTVTPIVNVVFHDHSGHIHANEVEIGVMFAVAEFGLAVATLGIPLITARMSKVGGVAMARFLSLPFLVALGALPMFVGDGTTLLLVLVSMSYVGRNTLFGVSYPMDEAFNMEVLDPRERASGTGIEIAAGGAVSALAIIVGSRLVDSGDYTSPFLIMAVCIALSTLIYWQVFRPVEAAAVLPSTSDSSASEGARTVAGG